MKRFVTCTGALALGFVAQTSFAADMPVKAVAKAPALVAAPFSWTGPYLGVHCGYAWGRSTTSSSDGFDEAPPAISVPVNDSGWTCGGQAGFNWQAANWVYGVESDLGYLRLYGETLRNTPGDHFATAKFGWYGTLTGRIGPTWDRSMLYLKGGAAVARIRNTGGDDNPSNPDSSDFTDSNKTKWGWALGAGFEQALQPNWSWKVEYLYMDFGKTSSGNQDGDTYEHRNKVHTVKFGLNYRFATGKAPAPVVTKY